MATINKVLLSNSLGGRPILITGTATGTANNIHNTGTSASVYDEVWLYANNFSASNVSLTIEYGSNVANSTNNDRIVYGVPANSGFTIITPGTVLTGDGSAVRQIRAFTNVANTTTITGFVNRIS
jgi:hypothetical protein